MWCITKKLFEDIISTFSEKPTIKLIKDTFPENNAYSELLIRLYLYKYGLLDRITKRKKHRTRKEIELDEYKDLIKLVYQKELEIKETKEKIKEKALDLKRKNIEYEEFN